MFYSLAFMTHQAYNARENFREANMLLGNHMLDINQFLMIRVHKIKHRTPSPFTSYSRTSISLLSMADVCSISVTADLFLRAAEESFQTALNLVLENESCQANHCMTIERQWEKGQHFLLSGRAQSKIGLALFEQAQPRIIAAHAKNNPHQQLQQRQAKQLLTKAVKALNNALESSKKLCHNTVAILASPDAKSIAEDINDGNNDMTWKTAAMQHSFEAVKLAALASQLCAMCMWHLEDFEEAEEMFIRSADVSDIMQFVGCDGVSLSEIANALYDGYRSVMTLVENASQKLKNMPIAMTANPYKREGNSKCKIENGDVILQMIRRAMQHACEISDKLTSFVKQHAMENDILQNVAACAEIKQVENEIWAAWEAKKSQAQNKFANNLQNPSKDALARGDIAGDFHEISNRGSFFLTGNDQNGNAAHSSRRFFIPEGGSSSSRRGGITKNNPRQRKEAEGIATVSFNIAFCSNGESATGVGEASVGLEVGHEQSSSFIEYLKWGDEVLQENERNKYPACCPPLPPDMPVDVRRALEEDLGGILPKDDPQLIADLYGMVLSD